MSPDYRSNSSSTMIRSNSSSTSSLSIARSTIGESRVGAGSVSGAAVVWVVSVRCCVFSVEVHGHRPRRSVTPVVDTEAGAQAAAGVWRARPLLWLPARRSGGGVCVWVVSVGCCVFSVDATMVIGPGGR